MAVVDSLAALDREDDTVTGASTPAGDSAGGGRNEEVGVWEDAVGTPPPFSPPVTKELPERGESFKVSSVI
jgi:hypothetical protein